MRIVAVTSLCCSLTSGVFAQGTLENPFRLESDGKRIDVTTGHAAPYLIDFDGDGVRDLLVGEFGDGSMEFQGTSYSRGRLRLYRNIGSESDPQYDGFEWFMAGGEIAQVPITCCVSFCPEPVDWDADGDMDMLTGSYPGELYLYRNNGAGEYAAGEMLRDSDGGLVNVGHSSNVRTHDWEGDGDLDLIIAISGAIHVVRNVGTREAPIFEAASERLAYRGNPIRLRGRLGVELADWDGDGRTDMLIGHESAGVQVLYDTVDEGEPRFDEKEVLIRIDQGNPLGGRLKMHVVDYNGDDLDDLLVGDVNWGRSAQARPAPRDPSRVTLEQLVVDRDLLLDRDEVRKVQAQIMALLDARADADEAPPEEDDTRDAPDDEREPDASDSEESGTHGYVWVYLRKDETALRPRDAFESYPAAGEAHLRTRLGAESATIQPGEPFRLGMLFEVKPGWFTYSGLRNSAPIPTTLDVNLPDRFTLTGTHWPEPIWKQSATGRVGTYPVDFVVTLTVRPPAVLNASRYDIRVNSNWQVCQNVVCTLGESYNRITLRPGAPAPTPIANLLAPALPE